MPRLAGQHTCFRVWLTRFEGAIPSAWDGTPDEVVAVEPLDDACYTRDQAAALAEGFNATALACGGLHNDARTRRWAVVVPVQVVFEGDLVVGRRYRHDALTPLRRVHRSHTWPIRANVQAGHAARLDRRRARR